MPDAVIVDAVRTPIGKRGGGLSEIHATDLGAGVLNAVAARSRIDPGSVDDVQWGCVTQLGDQSSNVGRFTVLAAGWPEHVPAVTVNRACGSSQQAVDHAAWAVRCGQQDVVMAGGVETMSRVPLGSARQSGLPYGPTVLDRYDGASLDQITGAQLIAERWGISRQELDDYSVGSHERAAAAVDGGAFAQQIIPVRTRQGIVDADEGIRRGTSTAAMATLAPVSGEGGVIHAGNASQISDAASALLVMSDSEAKRRGLRPVARYHTGATRGADPRLVLTGVIPATREALRRSQLRLDQIGVFEVNEAFAVVPLAWMREMGVEAERVNPLGGAIALGHPLGASGAILMTRMLHHMREHGIRFGLQTMCESGGTANATILELLD